MVNEVNSIIYNTLVSERAIQLPEVGTLSIVRYSATKSSSRAVTPPVYRIEFSSHAQATSLIDAIASFGNVDVDTAEDIYCRWLSKIKSGSTLQIDGVGTLRDKSFVADKEFIALFNPMQEPVKVKHQNNKAIAIALTSAFIGIAIVMGAAAWYFYNEALVSAYNKTLAKATNLVNTYIVNNVKVNEVAEVEVIVETIEVAETLVEEVDNVINVEPATIVEDWTMRDDIRHWVVVGSFSTIENAQNAINAVEKKYSEIKCKHFMLGKLFAVAIYGSNNHQDCVEYKQKYIDEFDQAWIFTPKEYR